jgi:ferredoxin
MFPSRHYSSIIPILQVEIFAVLRNNHQIIPVSTKLGCMDCGQCEKICTQHIPIRERLRSIEVLADTYDYSVENIRQRITDIFSQADRFIGVTPAGDLADVFLAFVQRELPVYYSRLILFDRDGRESRTQRGLPVEPYTRIPDYDIGLIVIAHYKLQNKIFDELSGTFNVPVIRLYKPDDIMWFGW